MFFKTHPIEAFPRLITFTMLLSNRCINIRSCWLLFSLKSCLMLFIYFLSSYRLLVKYKSFLFLKSINWLLLFSLWWLSVFAATYYLGWLHTEAGATNVGWVRFSWKAPRVLLSWSPSKTGWLFLFVLLKRAFDENPTQPKS